MNEQIEINTLHGYVVRLEEAIEYEYVSQNDNRKYIRYLERELRTSKRLLNKLVKEKNRKEGFPV